MIEMAWWKYTKSSVSASSLKSSLGGRLTEIVAVVNLQPQLTTFMLTASAKLRWQEANIVPASQVGQFLEVSAVLC